MSVRFLWRIAFLSIAACAGVSQTLEFNKDVRPILSDRCYFCHGPDSSNRKTKLRLDREADAKAELRAGKFGIVPGKPEESEIYKRISSTNKAQRMPPAYLGHDALPAKDIETIRQWIAEGATYQAHWAYLPPRRTPLPDVRDIAWAKNAIDRFLLARLEREGLRPSPEAAKRTLLRRVTLDLTGLPPTIAEMRSFLEDSAADAYEKRVDALLNSPAYAERMAIRWLEAARYADTNGYQTDGPREMWPWRDWVIEAFRKNMPFDQFTVEQIAGDLLPNPTMEQRLATGFHRNHRTSAEGGIVDEEFRVEYLADRAETTGVVWLGMTVGCARCHDHKFDPIPQKDFYSLFAFYDNTPERGFVWNFGNESPTMRVPSAEQRKRLEELDGQVAKAREALENLDVAEARSRWEADLAKRRNAMDWNVEEGLAAHWKLDSPREGVAIRCEASATSESGAQKDRACAQTGARIETRQGVLGGAVAFDGESFLEMKGGPQLNYRDPFTFAAWVRPASLNGALFAKGEDFEEGQQHGLYLRDGKLRLHATFRWSDLAMRMETISPLQLNEWQHVAVTYDGKMRAAGVRMYLNGVEQPQKVLMDQFLWPLEAKESWRVGAGGGVRYQGLMDEVRLYTRALDTGEVGALASPQSLREIANETERTPGASAKLRLAFERRFAPREYLRRRATLTTLEAMRKQYEESLPTVMVMQELAGHRDTFVLERGAYDAPGEKVLAAVPSALPSLPKEAPRNRLGLARWLVGKENPLTARVTVNRLWALFFGTGIVKTVEDFGSQGEWPAHPGLLDWLAVEFMESGWDVKRTVRLMLTSAAYRQQSNVSPEMIERDPENRLLARGPRHRLSPEMIRDQALAVSGLLVNKVGGPPVKPYQPPGLWQELAGGKGYEADTGEGLYRRSLYTYWRRTVAPPFMVNFDSPTRETCVVRETRTNTPLQALNLMNDVTFVEAARKLAERILIEGGASEDERRNYAFRAVLGRDATPLEQASLRKALSHFESYYQANRKQAEALLAEGASQPERGLDARELAAWTGIASIVLNLDETVTKE
ncbi:MAG: DUF1553 domain-containing protein [Bryobacterales bacterium]|nr:DUF1553 domain-containing protein [Bryobacterales bacterium]